MGKRLRRPTAKDGELLAKFGKADGEIDLFYCYPENTCGMGRDARVLSHFFEDVKYIDGRSLREELEYRGYDITTFKFSIMKADTPTSKGDV